MISLPYFEDLTNTNFLWLYIFLSCLLVFPIDYYSNGRNILSLSYIILYFIEFYNTPIL